MSADSGVSGQLPEHTRLVLVILLIAVVLNLLYPGEVFFQSRYLLVLGAVSACAVVLFRGHWRGAENATFRHAALAFLPLVGMVPSLIWTTNQDRSQEAFLLFFSYSCLLFSLWRCKFRSEALCASLLTLVAVVMVVGVQALYQHFVGLDALKAELMQRTNMDGDFRAALLARTQSGRVFANFSLPNTLAGLVTMILPIQVGLLRTSFVPSSLLEVRPRWITILRSPLARLALVTGILQSIWVLALTQSFGGWVCLCCSLGAVLFVWLCQSGRRADWIISAGLLLTLAGSWLAWTSYKRGFRLWNLSAAENPISLRLVTYRTALDIFRDFPVTGVGLGNYGTHNPRYQASPRFVTQFAHNTPLQLLSEGGVVLIAGLLCVGVAGIRWKSSQNQVPRQALAKDPLYLGMMGSLVAWLVHNGLDIDFYFPSLGALGFLVLGLFWDYPRRKSKEEGTHSSPIAQPTIILIEIVLGLAFLTGMRFYLSRSLMDLARLSASSSDLADANRYAHWAVTLRPQDAVGVLSQGKLETQFLKQQGKPTAELLQTLRRSLEEAVRLDPYNAEFHFELSRVYRGLGNDKLSDESRARAVALFPSDPKYRSPQ
jgi:O-antigen ligase/polysaccharide polymerase Wzy-like membrane protein